MRNTIIILFYNEIYISRHKVVSQHLQILRSALMSDKYLLSIRSWSCKIEYTQFLHEGKMISRLWMEIQYAGTMVFNPQIIDRQLQRSSIIIKCQELAGRDNENARYPTRRLEPVGGLCTVKKGPRAESWAAFFHDQYTRNVLLFQAGSKRSSFNIFDEVAKIC